MKKQILLLILSLLCNTVTFGQQKEDAEKFVKEGIAYHDKGDYEGAIARYNVALALDEDNLFALAEKALSLLSLQKIDESIEICLAAIEKHPGENGLRIVYVTCGNAYDGLKKTDKAIEMYDEGIEQFPDFFLLYFNKGITLSSVEKYDEAIICFQKSVSLNPQHSSSHNALGVLLDINGKRIPSLLARSRFLILEPQGERAQANLASLQRIMKGNVEQTGKNSVTINISPDMLGDSITDVKSGENNFTSTDLILTMTAALDYDKKNKKKTEIEQFIRKFETVCSSLKETQKDNYGFYWEYYVPYFIEMRDKNLIETFAYIAFATSDDPEILKWLKSHESSIDKFYEWSENFIWKTN